jgi:hypothetical protein
MPALELMDRYTSFVLWVAVGVNSRGEPTVSGTPQDIKLKVNDSQKRMLDAKGNEVAVDGTAVAGCAIPLGSILWRGTTDDISGTGSAMYPPADLLQVKLVTAIDDLKGRNVAYDVGYMKYRSVMPWSWYG